VQMEAQFFFEFLFHLLSAPQSMPPFHLAPPSDILRIRLTASINRCQFAAFGFELCPPFPCQAIKLGLTPGLGSLPVRSQESSVFEPAPGRIKRALRNLDHTARDLIEALRYRIPVDRTERDNFQDQQVQRSLGEI